MKKALFVLLLTITACTALAQRQLKDSIIKHIPLIGGRIVYADTVAVKRHAAALLDSAAKKWFLAYFIHPDSLTNAAPLVGNDAVFNKGVFEFKCMPGYVNVLFYGTMTIQITCGDNFYAYRISDIYFWPHNGFLNDVGYERDPNYLIKLYYKKHLSFGEAWRVDKHEIKGYLVGIDRAVRDCIASLNKAIAN